MSALGLPQVGEVYTQLLSIDDSRRLAIENAKRIKRERLQAIKRHEMECFRYAQDFNLPTPESNSELIAMRINTNIRMKLYTDMIRSTGAKFIGPGNHPWFQVLKSNRNFFDSNSYIIGTVHGHLPLMILEQDNGFASFHHKIYMINSKGQKIYICRINRIRGFFSPTYSVELTAAGKDHSCLIECEVSWPGQMTLFCPASRNHPKRTICAANKISMFSSDYTVDIASGENILFLCGITCAIDRIHREARPKGKPPGSH